MTEQSWTKTDLHAVLKTEIGDLVVIWDEGAFPKVKAILLPSRKQKKAVASTSRGKTMPPVVAKLQDYFAGRRVRWALGDLDLTGFSEFRLAVSRACCKIPRGKATSYGGLAAAAGRDGAARAVGGVMAQNPFPIVIPCHRVVGSSGHLHGFGGRGVGLDIKRRLLEHEGHLMRDARHATLE